MFCLHSAGTMLFGSGSVAAFCICTVVVELQVLAVFAQDTLA